MKFVLILLLTFSLAGCKHLRNYNLDSYQTENGDSKVSVVDDVEIWIFGSPDEPYEVIGEFSDQRNPSPLLFSQIKSDVAKSVKEQGGDAAIRLSQSLLPVGPTRKTTTIHIRSGYSYPTTSYSTPTNRFSKYQIIRFKD